MKLLDLQPLKRFTQRILNLRGESDVLKGQLEEAQMEAGLNDAAALEMQRAFEEEAGPAAEQLLGRSNEVLTSCWCPCGQSNLAQARWNTRRQRRK